MADIDLRVAKSSICSLSMFAISRQVARWMRRRWMRRSGARCLEPPEPGNSTGGLTCAGAGGVPLRMSAKRSPGVLQPYDRNISPAATRQASGDRLPVPYSLPPASTHGRPALVGLRRPSRAGASVALPSATTKDHHARVSLHRPSRLALQDQREAVARCLVSSERGKRTGGPRRMVRGTLLARGRRSPDRTRRTLTRRCQ